jgi:uncharacterized FlaG/YvyC family protein
VDLKEEYKRQYDKKQKEIREFNDEQVREAIEEEEKLGKRFGKSTTKIIASIKKQLSTYNKKSLN